MQNHVLMWSPHLSPIGSTWSFWIDAESCAHALFFTRRKYVMFLAQCRIVCSWNLPVLHPQRVRDLVRSFQNCVLMGSPHVLSTESTWSRWMNAELCAHGIFPSFPHSLYVISLGQCRIVCSCDLSVFHPQEVRDLVGLMQNCMLMGFPHVSPTVGMWFGWIGAGLCAHWISLFFTHRE